MRATAARTKPRNNRTVNGFSPSVIMVYLLDSGCAHRPKNSRVVAHQSPRPRSAPVPGAPIGVLLRPATHKTADDNAAVCGTESWQRIDQRGYGIGTERQGVLGIERPLDDGAVEICLDDECVGVHDVERGQDPQSLHQYAKGKALVHAPKDCPREPDKHAEQ